jgi:Glycosyl transferase family 11
VITIGTFGQQYGKLGNQLFQIGLLFAVSRRRGYGFYLSHNDEPLWDCFDLNIASEGPDCTNRFDETNGSCNFDPQVFEQPNGTSFHGYFQSYRYLEECQADLVRLLRFRNEHRARSEVTQFAYRRRYGRPLVSLHIRRGDYVQPHVEGVWGNLVSDGYYQRAMETIGDDVTYLVFSDDVPWCRQNLEADRLEFADFDHFTSLCLMTGCDVNVVANSTFSWWGAFLNPSAEVYAPSRWWRATSPPNDHQDDIVPPGWRTIPTFGAGAGAR